MKVALINGPTSDASQFVREGRCTQKSSIWSTQWPPISLAYLAAIARNDKHQAEVFDCPASRISLSNLTQLLQIRKPDLCVIAVSTPSYDDDVNLVKTLRISLPGAQIAVLGVHVTVLDQEILTSTGNVDFVIRGEPEETFRVLLETLANGTNIRQVAGLSGKDTNGFFRNADRPLLEDLDILPVPDWEIVDRDKYRLPHNRNQFLSVAPMRGCPYHCTFCTAGMYYGHQVRYRATSSVTEEIARNRRDFGINDFFMWAETFTLSREYVLELADTIRSDVPGIRWTCNSRTDTVDADMLREMHSAGCWMISFGIESTNKAILKSIKKNLRSTDITTPIQIAHQEGIQTLGHFILGLPGDTSKTIEETIRSALNLDLDFAQFYCAAPFVGTEIYNQARKVGMVDEDNFASCDQSKATLQLDGLSTQFVDRARRRAYLRFYLRPRQIIGICRLFGFRLIHQILNSVLRLLKKNA